MNTDNKNLIEAAEKEYIELEKRKEELEKENKLPTFNSHMQIPVLVSTLFRFKVSSLYVIKLYNCFALIL